MTDEKFSLWKKRVLGLRPKKQEPEKSGSYSLNRSWAEGYNQALADWEKNIKLCQTIK